MEKTLAEVIAHAPVFVRRVEGEIVYWAAGAESLFGYTATEAVGRSSHELLKTQFPAPLEQIEADLERLGAWQGLLRHTRADGEQLWTESVWRIRRPGGGAEPLVAEMNTDVTAREVMAQELNHRVKNTLAVVQGIARLSFRDVDQEQVRAFEQRLVALGHAQDLLTRGHWTEAELTDLIGGVVRAFGMEERVRLRGPRVMLRPNSVVAYSLAFHELATNAMKHGALSRPGGWVEVEWTLHGERGDQMHLLWREHGGPPVSPPARVGFGSKLIQRAVASELGTPVQLRFEPEGLVCEFNGPTQKEPGLIAEGRRASGSRRPH